MSALHGSILLGTINVQATVTNGATVTNDTRLSESGLDTPPGSSARELSSSPPTSVIDEIARPTLIDHVDDLPSPFGESTLLPSRLATLSDLHQEAYKLALAHKMPPSNHRISSYVVNEVYRLKGDDNLTTAATRECFLTAHRQQAA